MITAVPEIFFYTSQVYMFLYLVIKTYEGRGRNFQTYSLLIIHPWSINSRGHLYIKFNLHRFEQFLAFFET